jgi:hypothetical protein
VQNLFVNGVRQFHPSDGRKTYFPVLDPITHKCIAVFGVSQLDANSATALGQIQELEGFLPLLGTAIDKYTHKPVDHKDRLAGEVDETSHRRMLFGKYLLEKCQKDINALTSKSVAELRSYRVPPKSVHRVLKGALYIFGHTPKDCNCV